MKREETITITRSQMKQIDGSEHPMILALKVGKENGRIVRRLASTGGRLTIRTK